MENYKDITPKIMSMFGLELEDEFRVFGYSGIFKYVESGIINIDTGEFVPELLSAIAVDTSLIMRKYIPQIYEYYYYVQNKGQFVKYTKNVGQMSDLCRIETGNVFKTESEARTFGEKLYRSLVEKYEDLLFPPEEFNVTITYVNGQTNDELADMVEYKVKKGNQLIENAITIENFKNSTIIVNGVDTQLADSISMIITEDTLISFIYEEEIASDLSKLIIKYIDKDTNNEIIQFQELIVNRDEEITIKAMDITNYENITIFVDGIDTLTKDEILLTPTEDSVTIEFMYEIIKEGTVTVKYLENITNNELEVTKVYKIKYGQLTETPLVISNYKNITVLVDGEDMLNEGEITFELNAENILIEFIYQNVDELLPEDVADITIKYVDTNNNELLPSKTYKIAKGDTITENASVIDDYENISIIVNDEDKHSINLISFEVIEDNVEIKFVYQQKVKECVVTVKYLDADTDIEISTTKTFKSNQGETLIENSISISGYKNTAIIVDGVDMLTVSSISIIPAEDTMLIEFLYEKIQLTNITINYLNQNDMSEIEPSKTYTVTTGELVVETALTIPNYSLSKILLDGSDTYDLNTVTFTSSGTDNKVEFLYILDEEVGG